ncbi:hypothetical protein Tco_0501858 [Tanacetum coccineum]
MAQSCFMKAEDKHFERSTKVHHLRAIALNAKASYTETRKLFEDAAKLFYSISKSWPMRDRIIEQHGAAKGANTDTQYSETDKDDRPLDSPPKILSIEIH